MRLGAVRFVEQVGRNSHFERTQGRGCTGKFPSRAPQSYAFTVCLRCHSDGLALLDLILRVLHRLRSLSEQAPLDISTLSYAFPLLSQVTSQGGIGVQQEDDPLEQLALSLDIIKFHCGQRSFSTPKSNDMSAF
jgi:hypothetical protein